VEALAPGDTTAHLGQDCSNFPCPVAPPPPAGKLFFFPNFQPATVDISIITASNTTTVNKTPTYTTTSTGGPDCPACVLGTATAP
jgi:hypothetical protein